MDKTTERLVIDGRMYRPHRSPFGFYFTAEEEYRYAKAIEGAKKFFEKFGHGVKPKMYSGLTTEVDPNSRRVEIRNTVRLPSLQEIPENWEWVTIKEAAAQLGRSPAFINAIFQQNKLPQRWVILKGYRQRLVRVDDIARYIRESRQKPQRQRRH